jgi:hypothetical protein
MSTITIHSPTAELLGDPLTLAGDGSRYAEQLAKSNPGIIVIVWDVEGLPGESWSFPNREVAA